MIEFGGIPRRDGTWSWFKPLIAFKSMVIQYEEDAAVYLIYGYDPPEVLTCTIWKGTVPDGVINSGYSQAQNNSDKTDFENNFKPYANRSIDQVPSRLFATAINVAGGGPASLAVDGSVTPVVFEYNPPNNYDIQITAINLLFEGGAMSFGNKFVLNALSTLANGLLLEAKVADLYINWQNMKRTRDLVEISQEFDIVTGNPNFMRAKVHLPTQLILARGGTYQNPDYIRLTVRDNLTALNFAEGHIQGVKL